MGGCGDCPLCSTVEEDTEAWEDAENDEVCGVGRSFSLAGVEVMAVGPVGIP